MAKIRRQSLPIFLTKNKIGHGTYSVLGGLETGRPTCKLHVIKQSMEFATLGGPLGPAAQAAVAEALRIAWQRTDLKALKIISRNEGMSD